MLNWIVWNETDYLYKKKDLALNNIQRFICHKTYPTNQLYISSLTIYIYIYICVCVCLYALLRVYVYMYVYVCVSVYVFVSICVCVCACLLFHSYLKYKISNHCIATTLYQTENHIWRDIVSFEHPNFSFVSSMTLSNDDLSHFFLVYKYSRHNRRI